jgi:threonine/homoserine/homoserine lactone efflux protein
MIAIMLNGFLTGLILQIAIGPVFFFILNVALQRTLIDGWIAIIAVTLVDYFFIALAVLGVGKLLEKPRMKLASGVIGSLVLILFGILMMSTDPGSPMGRADRMVEPGHLSSFLSAFALTISSPLTIVFWTSLFATKAIENGYDRRQLVVFGIAAGWATLIFLGASVTLLSIIRASIPASLLTILNTGVGVLLIVYGVIRLGKIVTDATGSWMKKRMTGTLLAVF